MADEIEHRWELNGGPAFPVTDPGEGIARYAFGGISARDYFAAAALPACIEWVRSEKKKDALDPADWVAELAYATADALLRKKGGD